MGVRQDAEDGWKARAEARGGGGGIPGAPTLDKAPPGPEMGGMHSSRKRGHALALLGTLFLLRLGAEDALPYRQAKDVVYGEVHGTGLLMDVFTPVAKTNGLAVVDVVSGAWSSDRAKIRDHTVAQFYQVFCQRGYTVFAVRPGSKSRYTLAEMDKNLKTGVRYIKEHAAEYGIQPQRLGLTGASAGGHLATLAALTPEPEAPDARDAVQRRGTQVRAVSVFFPPTDLVEWDAGRPADPNLVVPLLFLGGGAGRSAEDIQAEARRMSPLHRVAKTDVPFLIFHGDADTVVPLSHSRKLVAAIQKVGGSAELVVKPGGGHPWLTLPEEVRKMADWFDRQLATP